MALNRAKIRQNPVLIVFIIGLAVFVILLGAIGLVMFQRHLHARNWTPVRATVTFTEKLCEIQYKDDRTWKTEDVIDCANAEQALAVRRRSSITPWRSRETEYAEISYTADDQERTKRLIRWLISTRPVIVGEDIGILVDPGDPTRVDRANTSDDFSKAGLVALIGLTAWAGLVFLTWLLMLFFKRRRRDA